MWWETAGHLDVIDHELRIGGQNVRKLSEKYGTPLYVINAARIRDNYHRLFDAVRKNLERELHIHYAMKADSDIAELEILERIGSCIDAVSPFEVLSAERAGFSRERILCTGTSFSNEDMDIVAPWARINIDSMSQLKRYSKITKEKGYDPKISIRINPGKGAGHCPDCITAGEDAKYGIPKEKALEAFKQARRLGLVPVGIHQHIGSGILPPDDSVFLERAGELLDVAGDIKRSLGENFEFVDLGGGIGIPYRESDTPIDLDDFAKRLGEVVESKAKEHGLGGFNLYLEPGRYIVGDSGILVVEVVDADDKYVSELGVNAGFNVLDRPARYKTYHEIVNVDHADEVPRKDYRVSGNLCESGDVFTESKHHLRKLPITKEGDFLAILNAGAYGSTMSSNYNMRPRARVVMVDGGSSRITRERDSFEDMLRKQVI